MGAAYGWGGLRKDVLAGLTVAAIAVPQAMAYALIAGVEPRFGLYSAIVVTALASIFGSSAHLINGPTNAISLVVFSALASFGSDAQGEAFEATFVLALMVGVIQIAVALFKLGDLTRYISESVVLGFMAGAGFLVAISQIGNLLGLTKQGTGHQHLLYRLWLTLSSGGPLNPRALALGVCTCVLVVGLRRVARKYRLPRGDMLLALILVSIAASVLGWSDGVRGVAVVGEVPAGLPAPHFPTIRPGWLREMAGSATAIAFLGLLEALAIAKSIAHRTGQPLDYNRQCLAEGVANFGGGLFQCLPGSGSLTRSSINFQSGAVSRWSGVFSAAAVAAVVVSLAPLARFIPKAALAGILLVTAAGLLDWHRLRDAVRASRYDAALVLATALAAVFISVEFSILIGTGLSFLMYVPRAARLHGSELVLGVDRVVRDRQPSDPPCTAMVVFDLEGELFFGAAPELENYLGELTRRAEGGARVIVLRVKRTRNPDLVCMSRLRDFVRDMGRRGVTVLLCAVRDDFAQAMDNMHFQELLPAKCVFREDKSAPGTSTLAAVRRAYDILGAGVCGTCPRRSQADNDEQPLYYMI